MTLMYWGIFQGQCSWKTWRVHWELVNVPFCCELLLFLYIVKMHILKHLIVFFHSSWSVFLEYFSSQIVQVKENQTFDLTSRHRRHPCLEQCLTAHILDFLLTLLGTRHHGGWYHESGAGQQFQEPTHAGPDGQTEESRGERRRGRLQGLGVEQPTLSHRLRWQSHHCAGEDKLISWRTQSQMVCLSQLFLSVCENK